MATDPKANSGSSDARVALAATVMAAAMLLMACGGDGKQASSHGTDTSAPPAVSPSGAGGSVAKAGGDGAFCDAVKAQFAQLSSVGDASSSDVAVRRRFFVMQKDLTAKVRETAPSGLRSDVEVQTRPGDAFATAQIDGDTAAARAAASQLTSPETQAASERVSAYVNDHCK